MSDKQNNQVMPWSMLRSCIGIMKGEQADAVKDCDKLYDGYETELSADSTEIHSAERALLVQVKSIKNIRFAFDMIHAIVWPLCHQTDDAPLASLTIACAEAILLAAWAPTAERAMQVRLAREAVRELKRSPIYSRDILALAVLAGRCAIESIEEVNATRSQQ